MIENFNSIRMWGVAAGWMSLILYSFLQPNKGLAQAPPLDQAIVLFDQGEMTAAVDTFYNAVNAILKQGKDRSNVYELVVAAQKWKSHKELSFNHQLKLSYLMAAVQQECRDQHIGPTAVLKSLLDEILRVAEQDQQLIIDIYGRLSASALLLNEIDSAEYFARCAHRRTLKFAGEESCAAAESGHLYAYALIEAGKDEMALIETQNVLERAKNYCLETSSAYIDAYRLMGYFYVKSNYKASLGLPYYQHALNKSLLANDGERAYKSLYFICRTGILSNDDQVVEEHMHFFDSIAHIGDRMTVLKSELARLDLAYSIARKEKQISRSIELKYEFLKLLKDEFPERKTAILDGYYSLIEMTIQSDDKNQTQIHLNQLVGFVKNYTLNKDQQYSYHHIVTRAHLFLEQWSDAQTSIINGINALYTSRSRIKTSAIEGVGWGEVAGSLPALSEVSDLFFYRLFLMHAATIANQYYLSKGAMGYLNQKFDFQSKGINCLIQMIESDDERISLQSSNSIAYDFEHFIDTNIELYRVTKITKYLEEAFRLTDIASNLTFFRGQKQREIAKRTPLADSILRLKSALISELTSLQLISQSSEQLKVKNKEGELRIRLELSRLNLFLEEAEPLYMSHTRAVQGGDLSDFQERILDEHTAFIQYFIYDQGHVFVVLKNEVKYISLDSAIRIEKAIDQLEYYLNSPDAKIDSFVVANEHLSSLIFKKVIENLPQTINRLIISPYGSIARVNFESLIIKPTKLPLLFGTLPYVVRDYALTYGFSMSALMSDYPQDDAPLSFLGVAPQYAALDESATVQDTENTRDGFKILPPLFGARKEINDIGKMLGYSSTLLDEKAEEANVKNEMLKYDIWHFAMHATLNEENPMLSGLNFSFVSALEDGHLTAAEIYQMNVDAKLVVLSACNTGVGKYNYVNGTMSLAQAFAYSGAQSTILSSWPAPDMATAEFFPWFYQQLIDDVPKDLALQKAKLSWIASQSDDRFRHPYYWSAFALWGDRGAINLQKARFIDPTTLGLILLIVTGLALLLVSRRRRKSLA